MKTIEMLTKRNMKLYLRDKTTVFFSMLTIIIIIVLNVFFLGKLNIDNIVYKYPGFEKEAKIFVDTWVLSGIIYTSTLTVTLAVIGVMINDEEEKKMRAFSTSPVKRVELALGYILSAFITGFLMSIFTFILSQIYIFLSGGELLSAITTLKVVSAIILNVFCNSCIVFFIASMLKSASSFAALNIILGTLIGFLAGIYLPIGSLPNIVQKVLGFTPFLHGAALIRRHYTSVSLQTLFKGIPLEIINEYSDSMGITISQGSGQISVFTQNLILFLCAFICITLSVFILSIKNGSDR